VIARPSRLVLLGHPVAHSLSPAFQNAALRSAGIPLTYEALDVAPSALEETLRALVRQGAAGNVTVPHKEAVARACDRLEALAGRTGAVNVFWTDDPGALVGDNTDVGGFDAAVRALLGRAPRELRVGLVGAGGSAAAVLAAVERWPGATASVWSRTSDRATALVARFASVARAASSLDEVVRQADLVVHATPVGMADDALPFDVALLRDDAALVDLVYRRGETALVCAARARGLLACDGLPMLVEQGALAFERWFGVEPDREAMWRAVRG
jgi:shikimate dehydrogenase